MAPDGWGVDDGGHIDDGRHVEHDGLKHRNGC